VLSIGIGAGPFRWVYQLEEMDSNDARGKGNVTDEKEKIPIDSDLKGDAPINSGSNKKTDDKKKRIKNIIYYESNTFSSSQKTTIPIQRKTQLNKLYQNIF
jgi:hypothetical protein